jgi:hypothetical protein
MMIEEKPTVESVDTESAEGVEDSAQKLMASNRHRVALAAGLVGILIIAGVVIAVVGLVGNAFKGSPAGNKNETLDFTDLNTNSPSIRGPSTSVPISPTATSPALPGTPAPTTLSPTMPTMAPTVNSTSAAPSTTAAPSMARSPAPSMNPTVETPEPTMMPQARPIINPVNFSSETLLTFCVIADVPYFDNETAALPGQIQNQMDGCEFLVHLGDIVRGEVACEDEHYILIRELLWQSKVPAFIVPGDNEWNDCGNEMMIDAAWGRWTTYLSNFEDHWNHTIPVVRHLERPENFYFVMKRSLVFGLNIVGGRVHDADEWHSRLTDLSDWVRTISLLNYPIYADGVFIMAHAHPTADHDAFFNPLRRIVRDDFGNQVPFLYLHGDGHKFQYERGFLNQPNLVRMQHEGGTRDPIMKIYADPFFQGNQVHNAFQYDRQLQFDVRKLKDDHQLDKEDQLHDEDSQQ